MITKEQIELAAKAHVEKPYNAKAAPLFLGGMKEGFVDGAQWAATNLQIEIARKSDECQRWLTVATLAQRSEAALQAEKQRLREALSNIESIAKRGDVNVQPLLAIIIEHTKEALAR